MNRDLDPLVAILRLLGEGGDSAGAERCFRRAVELDPSDAQTMVNLATSLALQQRLEEAIPYYERALRLDPTHVAAREMLISAREFLESMRRGALPPALETPADHEPGSGR